MAKAQAASVTRASVLTPAEKKKMIKAAEAAKKADNDAKYYMTHLSKEAEQQELAAISKSRARGNHPEPPPFLMTPARVPAASGVVTGEPAAPAAPAAL